jgi:hypothetical protein
MRFLIVAAAAAALGTAGVAHAQYPGQYGYGQYGGYGSDWNYSGGRHALFNRAYRHTIEGIRHGLSDGSYSRWEANRFYRELESIRYDAMRSMRYGNYNHRYIQARMDRLHQRMHFRHDRNHERYDDYGSYGRYANQPGYDGYGHRHDHDDD